MHLVFADRLESAKRGEQRRQKLQNATERDRTNLALINGTLELFYWLSRWGLDTENHDVVGAHLRPLVEDIKRSSPPPEEVPQRVLDEISRLPVIERMEERITAINGHVPSDIKTMVQNCIRWAVVAALYGVYNRLFLRY